MIRQTSVKEKIKKFKNMKVKTFLKNNKYN